jgi:hypothetical protein
MFTKINLLFVAYPKSAFALFRHKTKFFPFSQLQKVFCDEQKPSFTLLSFSLSVLPHTIIYVTKNLKKMMCNEAKQTLSK